MTNFYDGQSVWVDVDKYGINLGTYDYDGKAELSPDDARAIAAALIAAAEHVEKEPK